jgi:predicted nucleotidyltransferase
MATDVLADPVLVRFRADLDKAYGDRVERAVLFGSRARGDWHEESDYDIAVFLHNAGDFWDDVQTLARIGVPILIDTGAVISAKPFPAGSYRERSPLMHEIRQEGVDF